MREIEICSNTRDLVSQLKDFTTIKEVSKLNSGDNLEYDNTSGDFQKIFDLYMEEKCNKIGKGLAGMERCHIIRSYIKNIDNKTFPDVRYIKASDDVDKRFHEKYEKNINELEEYCDNYYQSYLFREILMDKHMPKSERKIVVDESKLNEKQDHVCLAPYYCKELNDKKCYYQYDLPGFDFKKTVGHINQTFLYDVIYDSSNDKDIIDENMGVICNLKNKDNSKNKMNMFYNNYFNLNFELTILFDNDKIDLNLEFLSDDLFTNDMNKYWEKDMGKLSKYLSGNDLKTRIQKITSIYSNTSNTRNEDDYKINIDSEDDWVSDDESDTKILDVEDENTVQIEENTNDHEKINNKEETGLQSHFIDITPVKIQKTSQGFYTQIIKSEYPMAHTVSLQVTEECFEKIDKQFFASYKFELDLFQKQACVSIANNENVFISAHTSAGKTLIAEFACRFHTHACQKVFYTSPIKALSNQKYNDFRGIFNDVGLVTGDTQLNKEAEILIITTEILQSMLYNDSQMLNNLACVVFDEVHYINNADRGHVWEEVLIMLPKEVKVVMLSATVPNYIEFSDWVGRVLDDKVVCITTLYRPVQLKHQVYVEAYNKQEKNFITLMIGDKQNINYTEYARINNELNEKNNEGNKSSNPKKSIPNKVQTQIKNKGKQAANRVISNLYQVNGPNSLGSYNGTYRNMYSTLIKHLHFAPDEERKTPMVVFVFSRKQCDNYVAMLHNVDLTTSEEKFHINTIFKNAKSFLKDENLDLPQIMFVEESCKRGIAMHHSGMLPFLKEIVEITFSRGYVKVLFATETFAMGINMPTKTVVFDDIKKFDNSTKRLLTPTEYTQMAGRAGRRGLDKAGHVIILAKNKILPDVKDLREIMTGKSVTLSSKFKITNEMVLNVFQRECRSIRDFINNSFAHSDTLRFVENVDEQKEELNKMLEEVKKNKCKLCDKDENYSTISLVQTFATLIKARQQYNKLVLEHSPANQLGVGRVVIVDIPEYQLSHILGIVIKRLTDDIDIIVLAQEDEGYDRKKEFNIGNIRLEKDNLFLHTLLTRAYQDGAEYVDEKYCILNNNKLRQINNVPIRNIVTLLKLKFKPNDVKDMVDSINEKAKNKTNNRNISNVMLKLQQIAEKLTKKNFDVNLILEPVSLKHYDYSYFLDTIKDCKNELLKKIYPCFECTEGYKHYQSAVEEYFIHDHLQMINNRMNVETLEVYEEYISKVKALKKLKFLECTSRHEEDNEENTIISFKGRSACRMGSFQVLITEIIYRGLIKNKSPEYIAAMIAIIASEGSREFGENKECTEDLERAPVEELEEIQSVFKMVHDYINEAFTFYQTSNNDHIESYSPSMMEVAYLWMKGVSLSNIMKIHTIPEGNIVRNLRKIWDLLNGMKKVLEHMGTTDEAAKIDDMSKKMARGIVFSASLYTVGGDDDKRK
uniref:Helicase ATP-binding domain-containing protein n=1 Tax=Strongyloides papillosus TaxID=174720 RepID=A0A0N5B7X3_STREA